MAKPTLNNVDREIAARNFQLQQAGLLDTINQSRLSKIDERNRANKEFLENRATIGDLAPMAGAIGAGLIAAPFTGGLSLAPTLAVLGGASAIGGGAGKLLDEATDYKEGIDFGNVAEEAALSGAFGAAGGGLGRAVQVARAGLPAGQIVTGTGDELARAAAASRLAKAGEVTTRKGRIGQGALREQGKIRGISGGVKDGGRTIRTTEADDLNKFLNETYKVKSGTLETQVDDLVDKITKDEELLTGALKNNNQRFAQGEVTKMRQAIQKELDRIPGLRPSENAKVQDFLKQLNRVKTVRSGVETRRSFQDIINFNRNSASPDPVTEQAANVIRRNLNGLINAKAGKVAEINSRLSQGYTAEGLMLNRLNPQSLVNVTRDGGIVGRILDSGPVESATSRISGALATRGGGNVSQLSNTLSGALGRVAGDASAATAGQLSGRAIQSLMSQLDENDPTDAAIMQDLQESGLISTGLPGETIDNQITNTLVAGGELPPESAEIFGFAPQEQTLASVLSDPAVVQQMMFMDLQQTGGKNIGELQTIFDMGELIRAQQTAGAPEVEELNATQQKEANNALSGINAIGTIRANLGDLSKTALPGRGILGGIGARVLGTGELDTAIKEASDVITRLRTGAAINANEERFYKSQLPQAFDSPEVIEQKLGQLENLFMNFISPNRARQQISQLTGTPVVSGDESLADVLTGLGVQ